MRVTYKRHRLEILPQRVILVGEVRDGLVELRLRSKGVRVLL